MMDDSSPWKWSETAGTETKWTWFSVHIWCNNGYSNLLEVLVIDEESLWI